MLRSADHAVLRDLARIAGREGLRFFVIGAGARYLGYDLPHAVPGGRGTTDWDVAVRVASWTEYVQLRRTLTADGSPFRPSGIEHRLVHARGRFLDIVPFGGVEAADRTVSYPEGGTAHSVLGLRECEDGCVAVDVGDGITVMVVGPVGLVLLKAQAYLDRRPGQTRDIQDIDFILRTYRDVLGDGAVLARAADVLQEERVSYEHVGAYLFGLDVVESGADDAVLVALRALLAELADPVSRAVEDLLPSAAWRPDPDRRTVVLRYAAFRLGLGH